MTKQPGIKPSELILMAVHNLEGNRGASEKDIVRFISLKLNAKPEVVKTRVKAALARSLALRLITHNGGRFKMFDVHNINKSSSPVEEEPPTDKKTQSLRKVHKRVIRRTTRRKAPKWRKGNRREIPQLSEDSAAPVQQVKTRCKCCGRRRKTLPSRFPILEGKTPWGEGIPRKIRKPDSRW